MISRYYLFQELKGNSPCLVGSVVSNISARKTNCQPRRLAVKIYPILNLLVAVFRVSASRASALLDEEISSMDADCS